MKNLNYNEFKTGDKILINFYGEKEIVTIGDMGNKYIDIILSTGETRKVNLEEVLIEKI